MSQFKLRKYDYKKLLALLTVSLFQCLFWNSNFVYEIEIKNFNNFRISSANQIAFITFILIQLLSTVFFTVIYVNQISHFQTFYKDDIDNRTLFYFNADLLEFRMSLDTSNPFLYISKVMALRE